MGSIKNWVGKFFKLLNRFTFVMGKFNNMIGTPEEFSVNNPRIYPGE